MNICKVYLIENAAYRSFYAADGDLDVARAVPEMREAGAYRYIGVFETELAGELAAEEMFDLSNNPGREQERSERWGDWRSLSVGDIVQVNDDSWVCGVVGWVRV